MIYLLEGNEPLNLLGAEGFIETKIKANDTSYGRNFSFLNFWHQKTDDKITAVLCKFENTIFLCATENADFSELKDFVFAVGFETIQSYAHILQKLGLYAFDEFVCLEYNCENAKPSQNTTNANLRDVYKILFSTDEESIYKSSFDSWYADMSHRIRHKTAKVYVLENSSAAVISHITDSSAVISGVATLKEHEGLGLGSKLLKQVVSGSSATLLLTAAKENVTPFYIKNGFKAVNRIGIYRS